MDDIKDIQEMEVTQSENTKNKLHGFGGWLIIPVLIVGLVVFLNFLGIIFNIIGLRAYLADPNVVITNYFLFYGGVSLNILSNLVLIVLGILIFIALAKESSKLPNLMIWGCIVFFIIKVVFGFISIMPSPASETISAYGQSLGKLVIPTVCWVLYFKRSERVRNTYVNNGK